MVQTVPSPAFYQDNNADNSRLRFALQWSVVPINFSFNANKLVSPVQFFIVNPVRRLGGSAELFVQPTWVTSNFEYADLNRFILSTGARFYIPAIESGEYLAFSIGGKYRFRKSKNGVNENTYGIELASYTFFGILSLQFDYNFTGQSRYDLGINLKYY